MWYDARTRGADLRGPKGFALPSASLHYAPDRQAEVDRLRIEIWLHPESRAIRGKVTMTLSPLVATSELSLDAAELEITRVSDENGAPLSFVVEDSRLVVHLPRELTPRETIALSVDYAGEPRRGLYFVGPSASEPDRPFEVWTQGQDDDSRHWFPCFDNPNQKAKTELVAHVPPGLFALSNGDLVECHERPDETVYSYRLDIPHSTYLVSLVVGDYVAIEDQSASVPVVSYVHPEQLERGRLTFDRTAEMLRLFEKKVGIAYPYPRYAQICVADFIFGGMENTTATTLTDQILFDKDQEADYRMAAEALIAHELAHQWWGDLVTCSEWSHAWLNEGFATYFEQVWQEHVEGEPGAAYARLLDQQAYLSESYRRPLVERVYEEPIDLFDRHQYEKGACVLALFRSVLGDEPFWRALRHYGEKHRGRTVETSDLRRAIEEATGRNLESLFDQWVYGAGHPSLTLATSWDAQDRSVALTVEQTQRGDHVPEVFRFPVEVLVVDDSGPALHRLEIETRKQVLRLPVKQRPRYVAFDPRAHVLKRVDNRFPTSMLRQVVEDAPHAPAVIEALHALARRGEPAGLKTVHEALFAQRYYGVRMEAARALGRSPSPLSKEPLIDCLVEDGDPRVRRAAIRALGSFRFAAKEVTDVLTRHAISESSDYALAEIAHAVARLRSPEAAPFLAHLETERPGHNHCIRAAAVDAHSELRDPTALPRVFAACGPEQHSRVREAALKTSGELGRLAPPGSLDRERAREILEDHLGDGWLRARIRAADGLRALGDRESVVSLTRHADRELDGRARRTMRLAERSLRRQSHQAEEVTRLRDELKALQLDHQKLREKIEKIEARGRVARSEKTEPTPKKPAKPKSGKKKNKK